MEVHMDGALRRLNDWANKNGIDAFHKKNKDPQLQPVQTKWAKNY